jgi:flagellar basal-body rod protein FlgC
MDYARTFAISALGMTIERTRVEVAALNLANANTVRGADGAVYRPMKVVADARVIAEQLGGAAADGAFASLIGQGSRRSAGAVAISSLPGVQVVPAAVEPRRVYEPDHPLADEKGFMTYAGVDSATEMVSLMSATRAYEANVAAMNTTRSLALKALEIGGPA